MKSCEDVLKWCVGAAEEFGDPSIPICQLFFRWQDQLTAGKCGNDLACGMSNGELVLYLGADFPLLPIQIENGQPRIDDIHGLIAFGAEMVTASVWQLTPSLNAVGMIHAFVSLYDVPVPAPWERRIVLL